MFTDTDRVGKEPERLLQNALLNSNVKWNGWRKRKDTNIWCASRIGANFNEDNQLTGYVVNTEDATEQYWLHVLGVDGISSLLNSSGDLIWVVDKEYHLHYFSSSYSKLIAKATGSQLQVGDNVFTEGYDKATLEIWKNNYDKAFAGEQLKVVDYTTLGEERWLEIELYPLRENGRIVRVACHAKDTSPRMLAERGQKASERRFRSMIENSNDAVLVVDSAQEYSYVSPSVLHLTGYTPDEIKQIHVLNIAHPDNRGMVKEGIMKAISFPGIPQQIAAHQVMHKDGGYRWFEAVVTNWVKDCDIEGLVINMREITGKINAEAKAKAISRLYMFVSQINQAILYAKTEDVLLAEVCRIAVETGEFAAAWVWKIDEQSEVVSPLAQYGMSAAEEQIVNNGRYAISEQLMAGAKYVSNDIAQDPILDEWKEVTAARGWNATLAMPITRKDKLIASFFVFTKEKNFFDAPEIDLLEKTARDISFALDFFEIEIRRKKAEDNLKHSEHRLNQSQAIAHFGSWELSFETGANKWSEETCRIYGVPLENNVFDQHYWYSFIHPDDVAHVHEMNRKLDIEDSVAYYYRIIRADGVVRYLHAYTYLEYDAAGKAIGLYGVAQDVTDLRTVEQSLMQTQQNLRLVVDLIPHSIYLKDLSGKYIFVNKCFTETFVTGPKGILGRKVEHLIAREDEHELMKRADLEVIRTGQPQTIPDFKFTRLDGKVCYLAVTKAMFVVPGSSEKVILNIAMDITNIKEAENERNKIVASILQRNKDLDQFSYLVSHNLRSPVANILGLCSLFQLSKVTDAGTADIMKSMDVCAKKLDASVRNINFILQLKENPEQQKEHVKFEDLIAEVKKAVAHLIDESNVKIITNFTEVDEMYAQRLYLYGIFSNLISNSIKYRQSAIDAVIEVRSVKTDNYTILTFKDNGQGIDMQQYGEKVFGLYSRFHIHADGAGMGLYLVKTQVEILGGKITVDSEVNKGTTFRLQFATV